MPILHHFMQSLACVAVRDLVIEFPHKSLSTINLKLIINACTYILTWQSVTWTMLARSVALESFRDISSILVQFEREIEDGNSKPVTTGTHQLLLQIKLMARSHESWWWYIPYKRVVLGTLHAEINCQTTRVDIISWCTLAESLSDLEALAVVKFQFQWCLI
jgi:hypothetical protein